MIKKNKNPLESITMIDTTSGIRPTALEILHEQFNEPPADTKQRWRSWRMKTRERQPVLLKRLPARWRIFHSFWLLLNNPPTPTTFSLYHSLPPTHSTKLLPLAATQRGSIAVDTTAAAAAAAQLCSHQGDSSSLPGAAVHWGTFQRRRCDREGQSFKMWLYSQSPVIFCSIGFNHFYKAKNIL